MKGFHMIWALLRIQLEKFHAASPVMQKKPVGQWQPCSIQCLVIFTTNGGFGVSNKVAGHQCPCQLLDECCQRLQSEFVFSHFLLLLLYNQLSCSEENIHLSCFVGISGHDFFRLCFFYTFCFCWFWNASHLLICKRITWASLKLSTGQWLPHVAFQYSITLVFTKSWERMWCMLTM